MKPKFQSAYKIDIEFQPTYEKDFIKSTGGSTADMGKGLESLVTGFMVYEHNRNL